MVLATRNGIRHADEMPAVGSVDVEVNAGLELPPLRREQARHRVMAKAYWITCYHSVTEPAKLAAYAALAAPAIEAGGGRFLARGAASHAFEAGRLERTVLIEFPSVEHALAVHDGPGYRAALAALADGAVRDLRIVSGV